MPQKDNKTRDRSDEEKIKEFILDKLGYEYEEGALFGDYAGGLVELDTLFSHLRQSEAQKREELMEHLYDVHHCNCDIDINQ